MYVCVCKAVTDSQIKQAIDNGISSRRQLFHCFGVGGDCGKCNKSVKELLDATMRNQSIMQEAPEPAILPAC